MGGRGSGLVSVFCMVVYDGHAGIRPSRPRCGLRLSNYYEVEIEEMAMEIVQD